MGKVLELQGRNEDYYHTKKDLDLKREIVLDEKGNAVKNAKGDSMFKYVGSSIVTGSHLGELNPGDQLKFNNAEIHTITKVLERRNHKGVWSGGKDTNGRFFKVETEFNFTK